MPEEPIERVAARHRERILADTDRLCLLRSGMTRLAESLAALTPAEVATLLPDFAAPLRNYARELEEGAKVARALEAVVTRAPEGGAHAPQA